MHNLQDQSWPSDVYLFYQDVEEEREKVSVAKLENLLQLKQKQLLTV